jgi:hypothetical protein
MHIERHMNTPFFFPDTGKVSKSRTWVGLSIMSNGAAASCAPLYLSSDSCINSDSAEKATEPSLATPPSNTLDLMPKPPWSLRGCEPPFLDTPSLWLALYFALNLWLTLYNKSVLIQFPFPYTLTALHALCGTIGSSILLRLQGPDMSGFVSTGSTTQKPSWSFFHKITPDLSLGESIVLLFFSMLYTINIVVSNASLRLVTVPVSH